MKIAYQIYVADLAFANSAEGKFLTIHFDVRMYLENCLKLQKFEIFRKMKKRKIVPEYILKS